MKHRLRISILTFLLVTVISCAQEVKQQKTQIIEQNHFNSDSLLFHIKTLSSDAFEGRRTGTEGAEKAKAYIIKKFKSLNVQPLIENYQQRFSFEARGKSYEGVNVLGYIKGSKNPEDYIVISAHYDHEGIKNDQIYNGADDDASGIAGLFAFAEYFEKHPPQHSVILAAFDAEELGLVGSSHFVNNSIIPLEQIKLNINMDMIGRNDNNELYVTGTVFNDTLKSVISNYEAPKGITLLMGHDGKDGLQNWTFSSDHAPFHKKDIPFLYFGEEDHKDYHKPTDDFENIQPEFYKNAVIIVISVFAIVDTLSF